MKTKMKGKTIVLILIMAILIVLVIPLSKIMASDDIEANIIIEPTEELEEVVSGQEITLNIYVSDLKKEIDAIVGTIEYDTEVFEEITEDNFIQEGKWGYPVYNDNMFIVERPNGTKENELVATIKLFVKENVQKENSIIKFTNLEVAGLGDTLKAKNIINVTVGKQEPLYLSSDEYKIGDNTEYVEGDTIVSNIKVGTTYEKFIEKINTNGAIRVVDMNNNEIATTTNVGTGMTVIITKDEDEISLKLSVLGDLDGNGKVSVTDLSKLNQALTETITLEGEYKVAGDLDQNGKISVTDLSMINQILVQSND